MATCAICIIPSCCYSKTAPCPHLLLAAAVGRLCLWTVQIVLQREIHSRVRDAKLLDTFDFSDILKTCLSEALRAKDIIIGCEKTGVWSHKDRAPRLILYARCRSLEGDSETKAKTPSLDVVLSSFKSAEQSMLSSLDIEESGTVNVSTSTEAHLTSNDLIRAF